MGVTTPFTAVSVGLCALFSSGFWVLQPEAPPSFTEALFSSDLKSIPTGDLHVDQTGNESIHARLAGSLTVCRSWSWSTWAHNLLKVFLILLPVLATGLWYCGTKPPMTSGNFQIAVLGATISAGTEHHCLVKLSDKEVRTSINSSQGPASEQWLSFPDIDVRRKSERAVTLEVFDKSNVCEPIGTAVLDVMDFAWFEGTTLHKFIKLSQKGRATGDLEIQGAFHGVPAM